MRHTRRKERDGLDLARPAPRRRHKTLRQLCALLLGLAGLALLSMAVWGAALPRRLDDALAQHYAAQMSVMQRELFALRRRLAEHEPDAEENAALRNFLQSRQTDGERWDPVWTAARWPGGFLLAQPVQAGAAVLDRSGRFAGIAGEHGTVSPAGSGAGAVPALVGQALGTLTRQNGVLWVTGLPCSCKAAAGELAVTAQGQYWAGQLAAAPQPDPGGLTLRAPLEDTADETDCLYFIGGLTAAAKPCIIPIWQKDRPKNDQTRAGSGLPGGAHEKRRQKEGVVPADFLHCRVCGIFGAAVLDAVYHGGSLC